MKLILTLALVIATSALQAKPVDLDALLKFSEQHAYKDNRTRVQREKQYFAFKGNSDFLKPHTEIKAFPGPSTFTQITLNCTQCGTKRISQDQVDMCQGEFSELYKSLFSNDPRTELIKKIDTVVTEKPKVISQRTDPVKVRIESQVYMCEPKEGYNIRIDFFPSKTVAQNH